MDEYSDVFIWTVIVLAFIGGYAIVSFLASKMKTEPPRMTNDRETMTASTEVDAGAKRYKRQYGEKSDHWDQKQSTQSEEKSETLSEEQRYARILGVAEPIVPSEVRNAYRNLLAKYHPDKIEHLGEEFKQIAEKKTKEIVQAYEYFQRRYDMT